MLQFKPQPLSRTDTRTRSYSSPLHGSSSYIARYPVIFRKGEKLILSTAEKISSDNPSVIDDMLSSPRAQIPDVKAESLRAEPISPIIRQVVRSSLIGDIKIDGSTTCVVYVSVGRSYHEGDDFKAQMKRLSKEPFGCVVFILADTLQVHNKLMEDPTRSFEECLYECRKEGEDWLDRHELTLSKLSKRAEVRVYPWDLFVRQHEDEFEKAKSKIQNWYELAKQEYETDKTETRAKATLAHKKIEEINFFMAVKKASGRPASIFVRKKMGFGESKRRPNDEAEKAKLETIKESALDCCRKYVIEECAAALVQLKTMHSDAPLVVFYPKALNPAMAYTLKTMCTEQDRQMLVLSFESQELQYVTIAMDGHTDTNVTYKLKGRNLLTTSTGMPRTASFEVERSHITDAPFSMHLGYDRLQIVFNRDIPPHMRAQLYGQLMMTLSSFCEPQKESSRTNHHSGAANIMSRRGTFAKSGTAHDRDVCDDVKPTSTFQQLPSPRGSRGPE